MKLIGNIVLIVVGFFCIVWIVNAISVIFNSRKNHSSVKIEDFVIAKGFAQDNPVGWSALFLGILVIFIFFEGVISSFLGIQKSLDQKSEGVYCYYVDAYNYSNKKDYYLPAQIRVEIDYDDDGSRKYYTIEYLFKDDGSVIDFTNDSDYAYFNGDSITLKDSTDVNWKCQLTNKPAHSKNAKETNSFSFWDIFSSILGLILIVFNWIAGLHYSYNTRRKDS